MEADLQARVAFYLTGNRLSSHLDSIDGLGLRPALFSGYRDLTQLRYDFPLVLIDQSDGTFVAPLSGLIDDILSKVAGGDSAERVRKHVLRLEQGIRAKAAAGARGRVSELWEQTAAELTAADKSMAESLSLARANLKTDGDVVDCDAALAGRLLVHAWSLTQRRRAGSLAADIDRLQLRLSEILRAGFVNSSAGKGVDQLRASFGSGPMDSFDFAAMSRILSKAAPAESLSASRRARVENLLSVLRNQRFFAGSAGTGKPYPFAFDSCSGALRAYRERLPEAINLAKAMAMAELEIKGEYNEAKHDPLFASFGGNGLDASEMAIFPDILVCINADALAGSERNALEEILSADLPIKIVVRTDDVIEESPVSDSHLAFSLRSRQLANMALGMNEVFVLQSPASNLYQLAGPIQRGLDYPGPALFSVFSGAGQATAGISPYLIAAAALESRAFPAFTFDPSAGGDWASRFSLTANPQEESDWPLREIRYEDARCQTTTEQTPFTLIDFVACDSRYSGHFARVPREKWDDTLTSVATALARPGREPLASVPCVAMVDPDDRLQKVIVDEKLIREARRCCSLWKSLQELGGIHNSHVEKQLAQAGEAWVASAPKITPVAETSADVQKTPPAAEPVAEPEPERSSDDAYIETARCSTCNECVQLNGKMFAYDANRQAYIADASAGTYAQLVEAAENCQVSIIHPGKPRNPDEPGLEELMKRAEAFA
jgi:predicted ArsR family transcriptional regulator